MGDEQAVLGGAAAAAATVAAGGAGGGVAQSAPPVTVALSGRTPPASATVSPRVAAAAVAAVAGVAGAALPASNAAWEEPSGKVWTPCYGMLREQAILWMIGREGGTEERERGTMAAYQHGMMVG